MPIPSLTEGALGRILCGEEIANPILQILAHKAVPQTTDPTPRHRFLLSDGLYSHQCCILTGAKLKEVENGNFDRYSVISLDKYMINGAGTKKIVIMLEPRLIMRGSELGRKIGNPQQFDPDKHGVVVKQENDNTASSYNNSTSFNFRGYNEPSGNHVKNRAPERAFSGNMMVDPCTPSIRNNVLVPINQVNPYQNSFTIRGRIASKSGIRKWSNAKGEGTLFSFSLKDDSGEIRATAFKAECDRYFEVVQIGKVIYLSKAQIKSSNRKFSDINHEYELTLTPDTILEFDDDDSSVPSIDFNFIKIADIENLNPETFVDTIGVVYDVGEVSTIFGKATQKEFRKRDISLVDDTEKEIRLTLWNEDATDFKGEKDSIIVIKKAKVSDFNGKSLTTISNTLILIDPPSLPQADILRGWYSRRGSSINPTKMSGGIQGGDSEFKTLNYFSKENALSAPNQTLSGSIRAFISQIGRVQIYQACPGGCKKKLIDLNNGFFKCDKCNKEIPNAEPRAILNVCLSDATGSFWVSVFHDDVEKMLDISGQQMASMKEQNPAEFDEVVSSLNFRSYQMKIRSKVENYREELSLRHNANAVSPLNVVGYCRKLIDSIRELDV